MKKLLLVSLLLFSAELFAFDVAVRYVHDGDTIMVRIDQLPPPLDKVSVRLLGIDTPEMKGKCPSEKLKAEAAKQKMIELVGDSKTITLSNFSYDKYGSRIDANVMINGINLSAEMIKTGHAIRYSGGKKQTWCNLK